MHQVPDPGTDRRCGRTVEECLDCSWRGGNVIGQPCVKCGGEVEGRRCRARPMQGCDVCRVHGGSLPQVRNAARRRLDRLEIEGRVGALVAELGIGDEQHYTEALAERLMFAGAFVRALEVLVSGLPPRPEGETAVADDDGAGVTVVAGVPGLYGPDHLGDLRVHPLVGLLGEWTDRHARLAKLAADVDLDSARLRLEAADVDAVVAAFTAALNVAGLSWEQEQAVRRELGRQLEALTERAG